MTWRGARLLTHHPNYPNWLRYGLVAPRLVVRESAPVHRLQPPCPPDVRPPARSTPAVSPGREGGREATHRIRASLPCPAPYFFCSREGGQ